MDARGHDLPRTFASVAAELIISYGDVTVVELLGHAKRGVTERHYVRHPDAVLISAADRVAHVVAWALGGEQAEVLSLQEEIASQRIGEMRHARIGWPADKTRTHRLVSTSLRCLRMRAMPKDERPSSEPDPYSDEALSELRRTRNSPKSANSLQRKICSAARPDCGQRGA